MSSVTRLTTGFAQGDIMVALFEVKIDEYDEPQYFLVSHSGHIYPISKPLKPIQYFPYMYNGEEKIPQSPIIPFDHHTTEASTQGL